jgi:3-methyladenine DNA glycosylase/8-oxoguanine DNA glycosylase
MARTSCRCARSRRFWWYSPFLNVPPWAVQRAWEALASIVISQAVRMQLAYKSSSCD